jgi:hypothetical protein
MTTGIFILMYLVFTLMPPYGAWFWYLAYKLYTERNDNNTTPKNFAMLTMCATISLVFLLILKQTGCDPGPESRWDYWHP